VTGIVILGQSLLVAVPSACTVLAGCHLAGRGEQIAAGWADGCGWIAARRAVLARVDARALWTAAELWVLERTLRAHGQHRRAVNA
jgi:hypothetical protein